LSEHLSDVIASCCWPLGVDHQHFFYYKIQQYKKTLPETYLNTFKSVEMNIEQKFASLDFSVRNVWVFESHEKEGWSNKEQKMVDPILLF
jgi:hypothetical protein